MISLGVYHTAAPGVAVAGHLVDSGALSGALCQTAMGPGPRARGLSPALPTAQLC